MKQRIITGLILLVVASLWLFSLYEWFLAGSFLVLIVGSYEWGQLVLAGKTLDNKVGSTDSSNLYLLHKSSFIVKGIYTLSTVIITSILYILIKGSIGDFPQIEEQFGAGLINIFAVHPILNILMIIAALWWMFAIYLVLFYPKTGSLVKNSFVRALCGYFTLIPFFFALLFLKVQNYHLNQNFGAIVLLSIMCLVWAADSGAYFAGRAFGKHKMSPHVSPNKTFEGLLGGMVLSLVIFVVVYFLGGYGSKEISFAQHSGALIISAIITIFISVIGDLLESLFKREANIKDSGIIFPGHGGMLDRIDSLTASLPIFLVVYGLVA